LLALLGPAPQLLGQGPDLPVDTTSGRLLEAVAEYLQAQDWELALPALQRVLDAKQDTLVRLTARAPDGRPISRLVSRRAEAERLLTGLPPEGQEFYEKRFGPQADAMLAEALKSGAEPALAEVLRRFSFTQAGVRVLEMQAGQHAAAEHMELAALCYQRLLARQEPKTWKSEALFRAASAFRRTGRKDLADRILPPLLAEAAKPVGLTVAGKKYTAEQVKTELDRLNQPVAGAWLMAGGNPARALALPGGTPFLQSRWHYNTVQARQALDWLTEARRQQLARRQPLLAAAVPLAATTLAEGKPLPLIVFRSQNGVEAVSLQDGAIVWQVVSERGLERLLHNPRTQLTTTTWANLYLTQLRQPHLLAENSTVGTLSSDGRLVFAIDDYPIPPPSPSILGAPPKPDPELWHNRLQGIDLATGKLKWEQGGPGAADFQDALFLGAPLPVDGRLYALAEKDQELLLVQLDPASGKILLKQALATVNEKMQLNPGRRIQAVHLAAHQGVLVVPTNQGVVFGLDLLDHHLLWVHTYREQVDEPTPMDVRPIRPLFAMGITPPTRLWQTTPPVLVDGKVVYAAPDSRSLLCLSLRDGSLVWKRPRGDEDLYLAGVLAGRVLVVGSRSCQALDLATGKLVWSLATGLPSGQGIASNDLYYLPLREDASTQQPEVCIIDVKAGKIVAHARSRQKEVPGNLVFQDGDVISQTVTSLAVYPQLSTKLKEIDESLKKNPNDPLGLHQRAEVLHGEGRLLQAVEDWRKALAGTLPPEMRGQARGEMFEALGEALARDFTAAEKYLPDFKDLITVPIDLKAPQEDQDKLQAEQKRRQIHYLRILGQGRQTQGKLLEALKAYLELAKLPGVDKQLIQSPDEPALRMAVPTWIRGRIAEMLDKADAETRKHLEAELERLLKESRSDKDLQPLRALTAVLGEGAPGDRARLALAERLLKEEPSAEIDQVLQVLRRSQDAIMAARALEVLVRNCLRQGLFADAVYYGRLLERDHAKTTVRPGKTGQDLFQELIQDKRVKPYLSEPARFPAGRIRATEEKGTYPASVSQYPLRHEGEPLPFFQRQRLLVRADTNQLQLEDGKTHEAVWSLPLPPAAFLPPLLGFAQPTHRQRFPYQTVGHVAIVPLGQLLLGIDFLRRQVLWEKNLVSITPGPFNAQLQEENPDALVRIDYRDGWIQRAGLTLPLGPGVLCVQARDALLALDPLTGRTLWSRSDMASNNHLFAGDNRLFVVAMNGANVPVGVRALRLADGAPAPVADFTDLYGQRLRRLGHQLVLAAKDANGKQTFRLYDVAKGMDVWKQTASAGAIVCVTVSPELLGWVEPDGTVHVVDLPGGKELAVLKMKPEHLAKVRAVRLLVDESGILVVTQAPEDWQQLTGVVTAALVPGNGLHAVPVNGWMYHFDLKGQVRWMTEVRNQMLLVDRFGQMPLVVLAARIPRNIVQGAVRRPALVMELKVLDKRTGKLVLDVDNTLQQAPFHALAIDPGQGRIELTSAQARYVFTITPERPGPNPAPPEK